MEEACKSYRISPARRALFAADAGIVDCLPDAVTDTADIRKLLDTCDYEPIGDYAIIGDCRSAALVSKTGSIDWLCWPDFSSPSIFAALLDRRRGGRFLIRPRQVVRIERRYRERSAVLETTFHCKSGRLSLIDFMPPAGGDNPARLFRIAECGDGEVLLDIAYQPRPDYAREQPRIEACGDSCWRFAGAGVTVWLKAVPTLPLREDDGQGLVAGSLRLQAGQHFCLTLTQTPPSIHRALPTVPDPHRALRATLRYWKKWSEQCTYDGPHAEMVLRSCLTLKLLTHHSSGAVMAAATTSLPESFEAGRNWDYRYCWLRDTSLLLQSFIDVGFRRESEAFLGWLLRVGRKPRLQPLYDLHGNPVPDEFELEHLEGYRGRGPVRVGNSAHRQLQLDIFGEVIQTAGRFVKRGGRLNEAEKRLLVGLGATVCRLWRLPDQSIWEARTPPRHYTYSKLMCWVALDRLLALDQLVSLDIGKMQLVLERDAIRHAIEAQGFDHRLGSYVGYFGGTDPDAAVLLMLRYHYSHPGDPRLEHTYDYIVQKLSVDGFLYRYPPGEHYDGVSGKENLFAVCSFWAVDFLARSGKIDEANRLFERLVALANDLGLYAEQFDTADRSPLGNFPQAFTHAGLVTAALAIDQAQKGKVGRQIPS